jgi:hypothetical protein
MYTLYCALALQVLLGKSQKASQAKEAELERLKQAPAPPAQLTVLLRVLVHSEAWCYTEVPSISNTAGASGSEEQGVSSSSSHSAANGDAAEATASKSNGDTTTATAGAAAAGTNSISNGRSSDNSSSAAAPQQQQWVKQSVLEEWISQGLVCTASSPFSSYTAHCCILNLHDVYSWDYALYLYDWVRTDNAIATACMQCKSTCQRSK